MAVKSPERFRQPGQGVFGRREQRQRQGAGAADPQASGQSQARRSGVRHAARAKSPKCIAVDNQYVILKCDKQLPGRNVPMDRCTRCLLEACRDKKLRLAAGDDLRAVAEAMRTWKTCMTIRQKRQQYPGMAAIINDRRITILDLAEECIDRNGKTVLEGMINRRMHRAGLQGPADRRSARRTWTPKLPARPSPWARPSPTASPTSTPG